MSEIKNLNEAVSSMTEAVSKGFWDAYLEAALWASTDDDGEPMDRNYDVRDIDKGSLRDQKKECEAFVKKAGSLLDEIDDDQAGHDFWLTRNGHGTGFWDRGLGKIGDKLSKIASGFGEASLCSRSSPPTPVCLPLVMWLLKS